MNQRIIKMEEIVKLIVIAVMVPISPIIIASVLAMGNDK